MDRLFHSIDKRSVPSLKLGEGLQIVPHVGCKPTRCLYSVLCMQVHAKYTHCGLVVTGMALFTRCAQLCVKIAVVRPCYSQLRLMVKL